jgi:hypothetical protein
MPTTKGNDAPSKKELSLVSRAKADKRNARLLEKSEESRQPRQRGSERGGEVGKEKEEGARLDRGRRKYRASTRRF